MRAHEFINERKKKRKKRVKGALYGPGPYSWYGFDSVNSGESGGGIEEDRLNEKWSEKYKRSINCSNPRGFSQRAHCQGRKKKSK